MIECPKCHKQVTTIYNYNGEPSSCYECHEQAKKKLVYIVKDTNSWSDCVHNKIICSTKELAEQKKGEYTKQEMESSAVKRGWTPDEFWIESVELDKEIEYK